MGWVMASTSTALLLQCSAAMANSLPNPLEGQNKTEQNQTPVPKRVQTIENLAQRHCKTAVLIKESNSFCSEDLNQ